MRSHSTEQVIVSAYTRIPYALISAEVDGSPKETFEEFAHIMAHYKMYKNGAKFNTEGSNADYVPSTLRYKTAAALINKEARFLFGETPDIVIASKGDVGKLTQEARDALTTQQDLVTTVLDKNKFSEILLKAAKDCFIGKRVAGVVNFNEDTGVSVMFLSSLNFVYETDPIDADRLTKFVSFVIVKNRMNLSEKRIYKKKFQMEDDGFCYMQEQIYNGLGVVVDEISEYQPTLLTRIPAVIIANDGLTGDLDGQSEMEQLEDHESQYSKLANADVDAERKSMNQIKYAVDMDSSSTKGLKSSPGSFWDMHSDQNLEKPAPTVGVIESSCQYSSALSTTLDRIKASMYEQVEVPNISLDSMTGTITSGKALKAIYWPLIVRCKEKMKTWAPQLKYLTEIIIEGALLYPNTIVKYTSDFITPVAHEIHILNNYPLPEDEDEEKTMDLSEVSAQTMSRKSYMKKWYEYTDDEADEELDQIVLEAQLLDGTAQPAPANTTGVVDTSVTEEVAIEEPVNELAGSVVA